MADHPAAMEELRALLVTREPVYAAASIVVETSGRRPEDVVQEIVASLPHERGTLPA
jgi:shikimate kinase